MKKIGIMFCGLFSFVIVSCKEMKKSKLERGDKGGQSNKLNSGKFELYCWCLDKTAPASNGNEPGESYLSFCTTTIALKTEDLVQNRYLLDSSSRTEIVTRLHHTFLRGVNINRENSVTNQEARMVAIFRNINGITDTFSFQSNNIFSRNGLEIYEYNFSLIDSMLTILGKSQLGCDK